MIQLDWAEHSPVQAPCPLCGDPGHKRQCLAYRSDDARQSRVKGRIALLQCPNCGVRFCQPIETVDYQEADEEGVGFYLENGAAIDVMLEALALADDRKVENYLEIGCSFGFVMDYARQMLGWEVRGYDPGTSAAMGRRLLGLPITNALYDGSETVDWADLIYCSEVVEHVPTPNQFIATLSRSLRAGGQLILTTPNADLLAPDCPAATLLPILFPGQHIILYNVQSLGWLLRQSGFAEVHIDSNGAQLRAVAARDSRGGRSDWFNHARYRDYLRIRSAAHGAEDPLGSGLAYRLLKEEVNSGDYRAGRAVYDRLRAAHLARLGLDIENITAFPWPRGDEKVPEFGRIWPFNLCGTWYFRAMIVFQAERDYGKAADFCAAAIRFGTALRQVLQAIGADDMEMANFCDEAGAMLLGALAHSDPDRAVERALSLRQPPLDRRYLRRLLLDLCNLAHLDAADRLLAGDPLAFVPDGPELPLSQALGNLHLTRGRKREALGHLETVARLSEAPDQVIWARRALMDCAMWLNGEALAESAALFRRLAGASPALPDPAWDAELASLGEHIFTDLSLLGQFEAAEPIFDLVDHSTERPEARLAFGLFLLNHRADPAAAADHFARVLVLAPAESAAMTARDALLTCLALLVGTDRKIAAALLEKMATLSVADMGWAATLKRQGRRLFTDFCLLGDFVSAAPLFEPAEDDQAAADWCFARGLFLLNYQSDFAASARQFAQISERGANDSEGLYWPSRFHEGLASRYHGDLARAAAIAQEFLDKDQAAPAELCARIDELTAPEPEDAS